MTYINIVFENDDFIQLSDRHLTHAYIEVTSTEYRLKANDWSEMTLAGEINLTIKVPTDVTLNELVDLADKAKHSDNVDVHTNLFNNRVEVNPQALEQLLRFRDIVLIERVTDNGNILTRHFVPYDEDPQGENRYQQTNLQQIKGSEYIQIAIRKP